MSTYKAKTAKAWQRPWQVIRLFRNGAVTVNCSHRFESFAYWHASLRHLFNRDPRILGFVVRSTPEVAGRQSQGGAGR